MADGTGSREGYVGENCTSCKSLQQMLDTFSTYTIICINGRYPPPFLDGVFADTQPSPFFSCIVYLPAVDVFLWSLWLIAKGIQLLNFPQLACPCLDAIIHVSCFLLVRKAEADKGEVPAA